MGDDIVTRSDPIFWSGVWKGEQLKAGTSIGPHPYFWFVGLVFRWLPGCEVNEKSIQTVIRLKAELKGKKNIWKKDI